MNKLQIKLTVLPVVACSDGNVTVEKSLTIQYLKENEIHRNIFSTKIEDCNYIIRSVQPNDRGTNDFNKKIPLRAKVLYEVTNNNYQFRVRQHQPYHKYAGVHKS